MVLTPTSLLVCHRERVFPEDASKFKVKYGSTPYDGINLGIQTLAKWLLEHLPDDPRFVNRDGEKAVCSFTPLQFLINTI